MRGERRDAAPLVNGKVQPVPLEESRELEALIDRVAPSLVAATDEDAVVEILDGFTFDVLALAAVQ